MKFIRNSFFCLILSLFFSCAKNNKDISELVPEYKLIKEFSKDIEEKTGLVLCGYGINNCLPEGYKLQNGVAGFSANYKMFKDRNDEVSVEEARSLIVDLVDGFLNNINSDEKIRSSLDVYPFTSDLLRVTVYFKDENQIDLGQGVAEIHLIKGMVKYEGYKISEYTEKYPAIGEQYIILKESFAEANNLVKRRVALDENEISNR